MPPGLSRFGARDGGRGGLAAIENACGPPFESYAGAVPNYDYRCETCGHEFEVFQRMTDDKLTECPLDDCPGPVRRLLGTGAGIIFKGGGFYETDYRSDSYKKAAKSDADSAKPAGDKGGAKSSGDKSTPKKES